MRTELLITIVGLSLTIIGVVLTVALTEDGRRIALRMLVVIKANWSRWWSFIWVRLTILFSVEVFILLFLTSKEFIEAKSAVTFFFLSLILLFSTVILLNQMNDKVKVSLDRINTLETQLSQLMQTKSLEKEAIRQGWADFLRKLSTDISFTALSGLLEMAELHDIDNNNIVLVLPNALEHTLEKLRSRIPDVEPILSTTYGKTYKLSIYTEQQINNNNHNH